MKTSLSAHFNNDDFDKVQPTSHQQKNSDPFEIIRRVAPFLTASGSNL